MSYVTVPMRANPCGTLAQTRLAAPRVHDTIALHSNNVSLRLHCVSLRLQGAGQAGDHTFSWLYPCLDPLLLTGLNCDP